MKEILLMTLGLIVGVVLLSISEADRQMHNKEKHAKEIQRLTDSLAKCNGTLKDHICYPPYKNN